MKRIFLISLLFVIQSINAMLDEDKVVSLLQQGKPVEEVALATFEPAYHKLTCLQASSIRLTKSCYNAWPLLAVTSAGIGSAAVTGNLAGGFMVSVGLAYPLGYFDWDNNTYNGTILSNKIAKCYLLHDYCMHYTECSSIASQLQEKKAEEKVFRDFAETEKEKKEQEKERALRDKFAEMQLSEMLVDKQ